MRLLFIHADRMSYETKSKTRMAEEIDEKDRKGSMDEVLVCFTAVEKGDAAKGKQLVEKAMDNIREVATTVKAENVMIYPYAHLSSSLAPPQEAVSVLRELEKLSADEFNTKRSPFGWYKSFTITCKGHPLSELSRQIVIEGQEGKKKGEDSYFVLTKDNRIVQPADYSTDNRCFDSMLRKEALKEQVGSSEAPEYLKLCRKFGISWEKMSDIGHEVYHPNAALIFDLCADYAKQVVNGFGLSVFSVKGTNMFNLAEPAVKEHAELFGDRLYTIQSDNRDFVLRYAACHQQFSMMSGWNISYRQMPVSAFEIADAYRYEQSGETMLLFRLRRLNMPDLHVLCRNIEEAYRWFTTIHQQVYNEVRNIGTDYEMLVNVSSNRAFEENREFILSLLGERNKDCLIHVYPEGANFYWTVNIEYHLLDQMGRAREVGTVQIDTGNAKRFNITYADDEGRKQYPIILHTAIIGTIERFMYALFDQALQRAEKSGKPGYLPYWVTPEQVRLLPITDKHLQRAQELASLLRGNSIRVGVDDRALTISKKVREAKQDWAGYVIVIGDREIGSDSLKVYDREKDSNVDISVSELIAECVAKQRGFPFKPFYMPVDLSKRVDFSL